MGAAYEISMSRSIKGDAAAGFAVMKDVERFPTFMPNVRSVRLLESSERCKVAEWEITLDGTPLSWIEEGVYDDDAHTIAFRAIEGLFDRFDGSWRIARGDDGCCISFSLVYEIGLPEIEDLVAPILKVRMIENAECMLDSLEARISTSSAP